MKPTCLNSIIGIALGGMVVSGTIDRANAVTITLYDGSIVGGTPNNANLNLVSNGGVQTASTGGATGVTNLNTLSSPPLANQPESTSAGYGNYNVSNQPLNPALILDNNAGYTLSFTIAINSQTNNGTNGPNRAGFSVIALGSNNRGIEIGFRNPNTQSGGVPDIFSQNGAGFAIGEQNTNLNGILATLNTYNLNVLGSNYTLTNGSNTLLSGALRDYTPAVSLGGGYIVYGDPNFIFLGDNTTSAGANVNIRNITLTTNSTAVPEPFTVIGTLVGGTAALRLRKRLKSIAKL